jgi:dolichyl-phosphate beta-glucosyltransferase
MPHTPHLSVILPAYNEAKVIADNLNAVKRKLASLNISYEIIVVNDGSTDDTLSKINGMVSSQIKVFSYEKNRGKGFAVNWGMKYATGAYRLFMDADLATALEEIPKFLTTIENYHFDVLIGNRKIDPSLQKVKQPLFRRIFGMGFTWLSGLFVGRKFTDFTCGFKMFTASAADMIFMRQRIYNWAFDSELLFIALKHNLVIHEIPVVWHDKRNSKVRLLRDILTSLGGLFKIRFNQIRGLYR